MNSRSFTAIHGGNLWAASQRTGIPVDRWLDFSAALNPWARDWLPEEMAVQSWDQISRYPDPAYRRFRKAAAAWDGVGIESILPGHGTADLIHLISRWRKGARALIPVPTFTEYARAARADGGTVTSWRFPEEDQFSSTGFLEALQRAPADLVFLCNPNNPTGRLWPPEVLLECLTLCERRRSLLVVDEAYLDLVADGKRRSLARQAAQTERLIVLRSLTKAFGVPGLRLGYAVSHPAAVEQLQGIQPPWPLHALAAEGGAWLLRCAGEKLADSRQRLSQARTEMERSFQRQGFLRAYPSEANFLLAQLPAGLSGQAVAERLESQGILIRRCDDFEGLTPDRFLRVAVRRPEENRRFLQTLEGLLTHAG